jgi:hypothetical protein
VRTTTKKSSSREKKKKKKKKEKKKKKKKKKKNKKNRAYLCQKRLLGRHPLREHGVVPSVCGRDVPFELLSVPLRRALHAGLGVERQRVAAGLERRYCLERTLMRGVNLGLGAAQGLVL